jgi:hypothetical protein
MHKDLQYAIDKDWFGAPKDCVPKSALRQILDAAKKTKCQTPGAFFTICISSSRVKCKVELPIKLNLTENEAKVLETIHDAMEIILAQYPLTIP